MGTAKLKLSSATANIRFRNFIADSLGLSAVIISLPGRGLPDFRETEFQSVGRGRAAEGYPIAGVIRLPGFPIAGNE
ncbi:MAG TPA: hypothetical protein VMH85_09055, partial [Terriglobales bacterium]|nr:hypothetical protein [Terriglobales bacterium]